MRDAFHKRCGDFVDFQQDHGSYVDKERRYKDDLILKAKSILDGPDGDRPENVGNRFLELVKQSNFVGWMDGIRRNRQGRR